MAVNTDFGFAPETVPDKELQKKFGMKTDLELSQEYEDACDCRDWFWCELINMEFDRRHRVKNAAKRR